MVQPIIDAISGLDPSMIWPSERTLVFMRGRCGREMVNGEYKYIFSSRPLLDSPIHALHTKPVHNTTSYLKFIMVSFARQLAIAACFARLVSCSQDTHIFTDCLSKVSPWLLANAFPNPNRHLPHPILPLPLQAPPLLQASAHPPLRRSTRPQLRPRSRTSSPRPWATTAPLRTSEQQRSQRPQSQSSRKSTQP